MIGRLNHVAIAVRNIAQAAKVYRDTLGASVSEVVPQPEHGVSTVFITLPNAKIELLEPLGAGSPIEKFLERNPVDDIQAARERLKATGLDVVDLVAQMMDAAVDDIQAARERLKATGARVLGD